MDNNSDNKPRGIMSPWDQAETLLETMDAKSLQEANDKKRDLCFDVLQYGSTQSGANKEQMDLWNIVMPIPYDISVKIFEKSKHLDANYVKSVVFPHYELNEEEAALFDLINAYGKACGIDDIMSRLYQDALGADADFKAQVKYLEIMLNQTQDQNQMPYIHISLDKSEFDDDEQDMSTVYEGQGIRMKEGVIKASSTGGGNVIPMVKEASEPVEWDED